MRLTSKRISEVRAIEPLGIVMRFSNHVDFGSLLLPIARLLSTATPAEKPRNGLSCSIDASATESDENKRKGKQ